MHEPEGGLPRARSPFAAAFLSLLFPGLGQLYAGAPIRALVFAAGPILALALAVGMLIRVDRIALLGFFIDPGVLDAVFVVNLAVLVYRLVAIIDAYRVADYLNASVASGDGRAGRARLARNPLSSAGLLAIILVMAGSHAVVARYDLLGRSFLDNPCVFVGDTSKSCNLDASSSPGSSATPGAGSATPTDSPEPEGTPVGTALPNATIPPWNGKDRLNILLIGADQRPGEGTFNTDTLIVVSIDPVTKQVAMFSLPRDTSNVPTPPGPARQAFGSVYTRKINAWWTSIHLRADLFPGNVKNGTVGYNGLKAILGNLYGLDIKYFVEVNFDGFKKVVDVMGGVTVNVQVPVSDDRFPSIDNSLRRVYIPSGIQHMDGAEALRYARSRHGSNDFDRGARQQRLLLSMREQADPQALIPKLPDLLDAVGTAVSTDIPADQLAPLLGLASQVDTKDIRSYVFAPPLYGTETPPSAPVYSISPNVSKIRAAVRDAFTTDPAIEATRQTLAQEGASVWVLNGTGDTGRGSRLADYLDFHGLAASAPRQKPAGPVPANTTIVIYNGAEANLPATIAYLQKTFGVTVTMKADPAIHTDVIVTIGKATPDLVAPVGP
ncbi:MAG TPA: LCP family protein [Candidatus Limnocylindrales bacterium]